MNGEGTPSAVFRRATAQGLTRWDTAAVVTPALASRWIVLDDGLTVILRLDETRWADGTPVRAAAVADRLRSLLDRPAGSATVAAVAAAVAEVNAVTQTVLELRLRAQRPDLLVLLAQPEFALLRGGGGTGPLRPRPVADGWRPLAWPERPTRPVIRLRGEAAARAVARFVAGDSQLVLGGTSADAPILTVSGAGSVVVDPAQGLFALAVRRRRGLLATTEGRRALSLAIDRAAVVAAFGVPGWTPPDAAGDRPPPEQALEVARALVARVGGSRGVTMATPPGPGGRLLVAVLTRQLARAGIELTLAPAGEADLVLLDAVAPSAEPASTLELIGCERRIPCGGALTHALDQLRRQPSLAGWRFWSERAVAAARQDRPVVPLARPLRWSLVAPGLAITPNPRAIHPLTSLVPPASADAP